LFRPCRAADDLGRRYPGLRLRLALGCYAPAFQGKDFVPFVVKTSNGGHGVTALPFKNLSRARL